MNLVPTPIVVPQSLQDAEIGKIEILKKRSLLIETAHGHPRETPEPHSGPSPRLEWTYDG